LTVLGAVDSVPPMRQPSAFRQSACFQGAGLAALFGLLLVACGPTRYISEVSGEARQAIVEARAVGASDLAPYEYWSAMEYYQMAKEKAAYADFEQSVKYGAKARRMARRAKRMAQEIKEAQQAAPQDSRVRAEIPSRVYK
jgi:hypothetical protein